MAKHFRILTVSTSVMLKHLRTDEFGSRTSMCLAIASIRLLSKVPNGLLLREMPVDITELVSASTQNDTTGVTTHVHIAMPTVRNLQNSLEPFS